MVQLKQTVLVGHFLHFILLTILVLYCVFMLHFGDIVVKLRQNKKCCL